MRSNRAAGGCPIIPTSARIRAQARLVVRLAEIHRAADLRVHLRAAQLFGGNPLPDGRLHQRRPGQKKARAFRHQDVVAHHRQIRAARDAHPHDGRDLRNAHRAHHGVVAKHAAKIVRIRENIFLQRQKIARRIHQIDRRNVILDRDILRANDFLRRHREKRAGFHRRVVGDDHHQAPGYAPETRDDARGRRAAPFLVHLVCGVEAQLEKFGVADRSAARCVRAPSGAPSRAAPRWPARRRPLRFRFFVLDFAQQIDHPPRPRLEVA